MSSNIDLKAIKAQIAERGGYEIAHASAARVGVVHAREDVVAARAARSVL